MANKSRRIRDELAIGGLEVEYLRRDVLEQLPIAWTVVVDGFIVDARSLPPEIQVEARRLGPVPDVSVAPPPEGPRV